ncbi:hypothetical protein PHLGIDRAFT_78019 [Phlebiopsis gigantea 11061_1 CR5-6]|uniref:Retrovirus-related Pol polyprotein from transposon TNT 1-94 n=1 Tax=Phlebiopsis gigantea (strain 11061_1 CR5-6) TaxID=745531 RepID=A0A0C3PD59_PHLG1|nr:hypothetical protein PHLGIDRAFT_78019 [Phlebiopsis gigantea 11061_1 CR5-6]
MGESVPKAFAAVPALKSDGSNYRVWLQRVLVAALGCQCKKLLEADAATAATQQDLADTLLSSLLMKLPDALFMSVATTAKVPKDVMEAMASRFGQVTAVTQAAAERRLYSLECDDDKKVQSHLDKLLQVKEEVITAGATISDTQFANIIMTSCPPSYENVIHAYQQALLVCNSTLPSGSAPDADLDEDNITCYKCQGKGHKANICPSKKRAKEKEFANAAATSDVSGSSSGKAGKPVPAERANSAEIYDVDEGYHSFPQDSIDEALVASYDSIVDVYDSGATRHMTPFRHLLYNYRDIEERTVLAAGNSQFPARGMGDMRVTAWNGTRWIRFRITEVLYAPAMTATLISLGKLDDTGHRMVIENGEMQLWRLDGLLCIIPKVRGLYRVYHAASEESYAASGPQISLYDLHRRLGHLSYSYLKRMLKDSDGYGLSVDPARMEETECDVCPRAKATRQPIASHRSSPRAADFGDRIHMDVWGPAPVQTINHARYALTMIDDATRWLESPLMRTKDEALAKYVRFEARLRTQYGITVKAVQSDRGGEFTGQDFTDHLTSQGTEQRLTVHDTPQHNGVAERSHLTTLNRVRALLISSGLPRMLWGEAHRHAVWIYNRAPHSSLDFKSPFELRFKSPPDLSDLHPFGSICYVRLEDAGKLGPRAVECRWLGYDPTSNGHRVWWPERRKVSVERNLTFSGREIPLLAGEQYNLNEVVNEQNLPDDESIPDAPDESHEDEVPEPPKPRRSPRFRHLYEGAAVTGDEVFETVEILEGNLEAAHAEATATDPRNHHEALASPNRQVWTTSMWDEIGRLEERKAWEYVDAPDGANVIGSRWIYKTKYDENSNISGHRARLVAQGYTQVEGIDYFSDDTFAPVAKMASQRANAALAARRGYLMQQMDVRSAFLYGRLGPDEIVYLKPPPGLTLKGIKPGQVLRLFVCLYGLKQSGRRWSLVLRQIMLEADLARSEHDHAVFFQHVGEEDVTVVSSHVDDLTLIAPNATEICSLCNKIKSKVEASSSGDLHWLLGMEIRRNLEKRTVSFSQCAYIDQILSRYGFEDIKPLSIPMDPHLQLSQDQCPKTTSEQAEMRHKPFRQALGALMYAAVGTRPDIAYAVFQLARYSENPGITHWTALKRVFAYLKSTRDHWLTLGGDDVDLKAPLIGYSDADGMSTEGRRAVSGYAFLIGGAVSWSSKRQEIVALSTAEAEYVALNHATKEAIWLRNFLHEVWRMPLDPTQMYSDNQSAIAIAKDDRHHTRTKHIDIRYHFVRYHLEHKNIALSYCPTEDMTADILTKALPSLKAKHFAASLGLAKA